MIGAEQLCGPYPLRTHYVKQCL